mgnify:CR=1 FL=1
MPVLLFINLYSWVPNKKKSYSSFQHFSYYVILQCHASNYFKIYTAKGKTWRYTPNSGGRENFWNWFDVNIIGILYLLPLAVYAILVPYLATTSCSQVFLLLFWHFGVVVFEFFIEFDWNFWYKGKTEFLLFWVFVMAPFWGKNSKWQKSYSWNKPCLLKIVN